MKYMNKMKYMKKRKKNVYIVTVLFVVAVFAIFGFSTYVVGFNDHTATITVTDKERINKDNDSYYLVFGEDENGNGVVYKNVDAIIRGKWDSSTMQANLKIGETYEVVLVGYRIPLFSSYENIISVKEIDGD